MAWLWLIIAGCLEVFWATCMKFSQGFTAYSRLSEYFLGCDTACSLSDSSSDVYIYVYSRCLFLWALPGGVCGLCSGKNATYGGAAWRGGFDFIAGDISKLFSCCSGIDGRCFAV